MNVGTCIINVPWQSEGELCAPGAAEFYIESGWGTFLACRGQFWIFIASFKGDTQLSDQTINLLYLVTNVGKPVMCWLEPVLFCEAYIYIIVLKGKVSRFIEF